MTITVNILRRYTDLPSLIHLLSTKTLTFLDPANWDDKNDSYFMRLYKEKQSLKTLLALCFSQQTETYHHWRVFANGSGGVCIAFHKKELLSAVKQQSGVKPGKVSYLKLNNLKDENRKPRNLPFLKRAPFEPESEFRLIYESKSELLPYLDVAIPLTCIDRINLSPWMPKTVADSVKDVIKKIPKSHQLRVNRSTLIQNDTWANFGRSVVGIPPQERRSH
jgi:hypothetical protein